MKTAMHLLKTMPLPGRWIVKLCLCLALSGMAGTGTLNAQNLNGVKIQVAPDALTYLKFNGEIKRFEFGGDRDDYTGQVVESDQLRIKTLNSHPTPTNLVVTEGSRTHIFIIQVQQKIDINNFKAYYDYSDLKALRKLAGSGSGAGVAAVEDADKGKPDKKAQKQAEKERKEAERAQQEREKQDALAKQQQEAQARKDKEEADRKTAQAAREQADARERELAAAKEKERLKQEAAAKAKEAAAAQKQLKAEQAQREKEAAAAKAREQQLAKEQAREEALAKQRAEAAEKQRQQEQKEAQAREEKRQQAIAAAQEKDRQAAVAKAAAERRQEEEDRRKAEAERKEKKAREEALAKESERKRQEELARVAAAEKERQRQAEIARKKQEAIEQEQQRREEAIRQQQLAIEKERQRREAAERQALQAKEEARIRQEQRLAAEQARQEEQARRDAAARQQRAAALVKNPYWKTEWHKKYPQINFGEVPVGQLLAGEYFLPKDTLYNYNAANKLLLDNKRLKKNYEAEGDGVKVKIEDLGFSGVNCYFRLHITNSSSRDFLVGKMQLTWWKKEGGAYFLNPVYVSDFPVIYPGQETTLVFACRGVNARDEDDFGFTVKERITGKELQILFPGNLYNKQMLLNK